MAALKTPHGEATAKEAYAIYRGMAQEGEPPPHWEALTRKERGLLTWVATFAYLNSADK